MISILKHSAYKHGYLFFMAAWLYTISFLFTNYLSFDSTSEKVAKTISHYIAAEEQKFENLLKDSAAIAGIISDRPTEIKNTLTETKTGIFSYIINDLGNPVQIYWNTNSMAVPLKDVLLPDGKYFVHYKDGYFLLMRTSVHYDSDTYIICNLIPVYWQFSIENENIRSRFAVTPQIKLNYGVSTEVGRPVEDAGGKTLFYIQKKPGSGEDQPGTTSIVLRVIAIIILMIFVNSIASDLSVSIGFGTGFIFLFTIIVFTRFLTYMFQFPFDYGRLYLFSPTVYAASSLNKSLGDLLINSLLLFWIISFIKFNAFRKSLLLGKTKKIADKIASIFALAFIPLSTIALTSFLGSLVRDSADTIVSFEFTNFFSLNIYTIISFVIICFLIVSYFYLSQILVRLSLLSNITLYWRIIILVAFSFLILSFGLFVENDALLNFILVAWTVFFYTMLSLTKEDLPHSFYETSFFMPWSIFLMASVSSYLIYQNKVLEMEKRVKIIEKLSIESDPSTERLINVALNKFDSYLTENNYYKFYNRYANDLLKNTITSNNFSGYLNNFDTHIYTFDSLGRSLYNADSTSFKTIESVISNQGSLTVTPGLYYYESGSDNFSYIYEKQMLSADSSSIGYVFLFMRPKISNEMNFEPQLFRQLVNDISNISSDYAYAVYNKNALVRSTGNFNFSDTITTGEIPKFGQEFRKKNDYSELWYNGGGNKVIVVVKKSNWFSESITFFAYLFGILIVLILLQHFLTRIIKTNFQWTEIQKVFRFNIRTQIQTIIVVVSITSFMVIGITTITFFINRFKRSNEDKLRTTSQTIVNEIERLQRNFYTVSDSANFSSFDVNTELQNEIIQIAEAHNTNLNYFDVSGNLIVSSQKYIYDNNIISRKMDPVAYYQMHYNRSTQYLQEENILDYKFLSIYIPVKNEDGATTAFLNIPFINSENELNQEISNFLITLVNLNALIFIIAGGIAIWITTRITSSFTLIGNKMKAISFGAGNEEIEWNKNDELGELVSEYNKMVRKLSDSAAALARSEREGAWREMARQVAHEIKNPLTPMKLSIQYLQKAIDNNAPNVKALSSKVASTLVEQIDQLSKIAGDFSQFANISNTKKERFDLGETLHRIILLFESDSGIKIEYTKGEGDYTIEADKTQMNRLFTNLIKNAVESYPPEEIAEIIIVQNLDGPDCLISISDKGIGIPKEMVPKIFTPNFTTKSSGTGLGLAICKGIVESANGQIWFHTEEGRGTTFFVRLPLAE